MVMNKPNGFRIKKKRKEKKKVIFCRVAHGEHHRTEVLPLAASVGGGKRNEVDERRLFTER